MRGKKLAFGEDSPTPGGGTASGGAAGGDPAADNIVAASASQAVYTMFTVFRRSALLREQGLPGQAKPQDVDDVLARWQRHPEAPVYARGWYDVSGTQADADLMLWLYGHRAEDLQETLRQLRRTPLLQRTALAWSALGVHRDAEFNRSHIPGYLRGEHPRRWLTVYPFVRSYEWYVLPPEQRSRMLAEHGRRGAAFRSVVANTVAAFALGDYEWLLPLESDELLDLVDLMRDLRATEARRHVRLETPFYTGRRLESSEEIMEIIR